ncbi:MAG TPA: hypothetical protein VNT20_12810 [Flavisolibacter sp.]|jgi:hypothetical protein|nr:hypothetical protein [Flavisolibacter sp.]
MKDQSPTAVYQQQIDKYNADLKTLVQKRNLFGWIRLVVFVTTIIVSYKVFADYDWLGLIPFVIGIGTFIFLFLTDADNNERIANTKRLININEEELKILNNDYLHRNDGSEFSPAIHDYANDLDLFGSASLFQWANRCITEQSRKLFADNLLSPLTINEVEERQEAIQELSTQIDWRQQLQSFSEQTIITLSTEQKTMNWLDEEEKHFVGTPWKASVWIYTVITLSTAAVTIFGLIPSGIFLFLFGVYFSVSLFLSRNTIKPYIHLSRIVDEISVLEKIISWIETKNFDAALLNRLQQEIKINNESASTQIKELKSILDKFDLRLNLVGPLFLNSFLLWDVRQMMALNEWRRKNRNVVPKLFEMIAEMEVLNSLATFHFNHPDWCLPKLVNEHFAFESKELGHPLIPHAERINNNFSVEKGMLISLVTGSNMAGKSTFLRSIGVNIVLAQMGAPVCAKSFTVSPVRLMTSMRISDNLAENTSTFYAELKKLKTIIEAVNNYEKVFVLLDEILRGTNSHDRHTGSDALIKQLIRHDAYAVIATHDLVLAKLQKQYPQSIDNYHFDVQVKGEELFFDYKLKDGVCHSLNASLLMKKIGIELED